MHDITHMGDEAFKTSILMEIFHLLFKYIHFPELDTKLQEIYDLLEKLPDEDKRKEYLSIILKYVLAAGPLSEERVTEHTRRFPGGEDMVGVAAQEIEKMVEQRYLKIKPQWVAEGKIEKARDSVIKAANSRLGILQPEIVNRIKSIQSLETLDALFDFSLRAESMDQFTDQVRKITDN